MMIIIIIILIILVIIEIMTMIMPRNDVDKCQKQIEI